MLSTIEIICWISFFGAIYSYFLYPIVLLGLPKRQVRETEDMLQSTSQPFITFIITAFNEEQNIKEKIENTLEINFPETQREILVASDGSTDATNDIVRAFANNNVKLIEVQERKGKENAQLAAIQQAKGELLVFSDVATRIPQDALDHIVKAFNDPQIGAISSEDRFLTQDGKVAGEGAYVKYEMWLRRLEGKVNSLVGLSGSFFACRKEICKRWDINVPSDFNTALNSVECGFVAVSDANVLGFYPNLKDEKKEYARKIRTVIRGMAAIASKPKVLNPFQMGIFSFQVWSHKIMRWLVPWFLLVLLVSNVVCLDAHWIYLVLLLAQLSFYSLAFFGWTSASLRNIFLFKIPFFFMQVNIAIWQASLMFIAGKRITKWEPSKR
ncbi:MAG: glycosyltransferase family 2 protein [Gammaproteobacteria bacterium]|nr:glycosyltransferase family 2 protein [Gammaproteobacteria bacterium]MDH5730974.1 glycosyltransferase family 2 protein [Gammaproteobacteria bacterium]